MRPVDGPVLRKLHPSAKHVLGNDEHRCGFNHTLATFETIDWPLWRAAPHGTGCARG